MSLGKPMSVKLQQQIVGALVLRDRLEPGISEASCVEVQEVEHGTVFHIKSIRKVLIPDK